MSRINYEVTISVAVPVEEIDFDGTEEELESLAAEVGQAVFDAIARGDPGGRVFLYARLPAGHVISGTVIVRLEDTFHPKMRRQPITRNVEDKEC